MNTKVLGAILFGAFLTSIPVTVQADMHGDMDKEKKEKKEQKNDLKVIACPPECGFMIRSHDTEEMVEIVKEHAKTHHDMELTDEEVKELMKDSRKAKAHKDKDKDKDKDRSGKY